VKTGFAGTIDWNLTILVALSFLLHFGVIGALFSDWTDPIVSEDVTAGGLIDMMKSLPEVEPEQTVDPVDSAAPAATAAQAPAAAPGPRPASAANTRAARERAQIRDMAARADALQFQLLGVARSGTAVDGVLVKGEMPVVDLTTVAPEDVGAVTRASGDLRIARGDGPVQPGGVRPGLAEIASTRQRGDPTSGKETRTTGPRADALVDPSIPTVPVLHADGVIASLRPGFRRCYNQGLDSDPGMGGRVVLIAQIAPNGEVSWTDVQTNTGLSPKVVQCLASKVRGAQFERPGASGSKLVIPITLVQQAR
jgi:hypothetical protein